MPGGNGTTDTGLVIRTRGHIHIDQSAFAEGGPRRIWIVLNTRRSFLIRTTHAERGEEVVLKMLLLIADQSRNLANPNRAYLKAEGLVRRENIVSVLRIIRLVPGDMLLSAQQAVYGVGSWIICRARPCRGSSPAYS